jgi:hypothetical protein
MMARWKRMAKLSKVFFALVGGGKPRERNSLDANDLQDMAMMVEHLPPTVEDGYAGRFGEVGRENGISVLPLLISPLLNY